MRGAIGTFVDITERRRAEELQRETEGRFRTLADQAPVLIWLNSLDGCEYVNREYLRFVGAGLDEVRGLGWSKWVHPDDFEEYAGAYRRAMETRKPFDAQFRFRSAAGDYRWMKSAGLPRLTTDGSLVGFVGCSFDITDVKEAIDALQESDRRKDEFLATLAHELRNPLAPLRNGLGILRLTLDGERRVEHTLAVMERQLAHLVRLIDDLVDVSRISRGKIELRRQPLDLAAAVAEAAAVAGPRLEAEERELSVELPSEPVVVDGDGTRLAQVVANLLDNAAKYTDRGGHIRLAVERRDGEAAISVEDDGIGIPAEMLGRIFEMFTQVDRPLEREQQGGLGIGLTLVKRLMELHGGSVEASSDGAGRGSRFVVRLPLAGGGDERAAELAPARAAANPAPARAGGRRQRRRGRQSDRDAPPHGPRGRERARRVGGARDRGSVPARRRPARHRHAEAERLRGLPAAAGAAVGRRSAHRRGDRLGTGLGQAARAGGGVRSPPHQTDGSDRPLRSVGVEVRAWSSRLARPDGTRRRRDVASPAARNQG